MKISKIAKLCKETKEICTKGIEGGVWIGNGKCAYLLPEFAYLEQSGIALAFGIAEKDRDKYIFFEMKLDSFNIRDIDEAETLCDKLDFIFSTASGTVQAYRTQEGVKFLNANMLAPLKDEIENVEIYLRHTTNGRAYFVAKVGMEIYAFFQPEEIINQSFIERLEEFNILCRMSFQNDCAEQKQEYEQTTLEG